MTKIAKTIDAAPRSPANETSNICFILHLKNFNIKNTTKGLTIKVRTSIMLIASRAILANLDGVASKPSKKKINICISPVIPSKKITRFFLN